MKKLVTIMLAMGIALAAFAQPQGGGHKHMGEKPDFEKIKAEKVAFITEKVGLTSKEAEAFWPVYNKIEDQQNELNKAEREAYMALEKAINDGEGNVDSLLDTYLKAKEANVNLHVKGIKDYKKVLSAEKLAKFYTCDESFRRQQIGRVMGGANRGHMGMPGGGHHSKGGREFKGDGKQFRGDFAPRGPRPDFPGKDSNGKAL